MHTHIIVGYHISQRSGCVIRVFTCLEHMKILTGKQNSSYQRIMIKIDVTINYIHQSVLVNINSPITEMHSHCTEAGSSDLM